MQIGIYVRMPLLFILLALAFAMCGDWFAALRSPGRPAVANGVVLALSAAALLQTNGYNFRNFNSLAQCVLRDEPPELAGDAAMLVAAINLREATSPNARWRSLGPGSFPTFRSGPPSIYSEKTTGELPGDRIDRSTRRHWTCSIWLPFPIFGRGTVSATSNIPSRRSCPTSFNRGSAWTKSRQLCGTDMSVRSLARWNSSSRRTHPKLTLLRTLPNNAQMRPKYGNGQSTGQRVFRIGAAVGVVRRSAGRPRRGGWPLRRRRSRG